MRARYFCIGKLALAAGLIIAPAAPLVAQNPPPPTAPRPGGVGIPGGFGGPLAQPSTAPPTEPYHLPETVANVNGVMITRQQLDQELEKSRDAFGILFALIMARLADQRAQQLGLAPTPLQIDEAYQRTEMQTRGQLGAILQNSHTTRAEFEQNVLKPQLEFEALAHQGVTVSDADVQTYIAQHRMEWSQPDLITLYRIHVNSLAAARKAKAELQKGMPWEKALAQYSDDPPYYKNHGGLYGEVIRRLLPPEIQNAVAMLKPNEVSDPVSVPGDAQKGGYVIWRVAKVIHKDEPPVADIRAQLSQQKARPIQEVMRELVKGANLTDLPPGFRERFLVPLLAEQPPAPPRPGLPSGGPPPPPGP